MKLGNYSWNYCKKHGKYAKISGNKNGCPKCKNKLDIMRKYTSYDLIRFRNFANENIGIKPIELIKAYNEKYPELSSKEKMINISRVLGIKTKKENNVILDDYIPSIVKYVIKRKRPQTDREFIEFAQDFYKQIKKKVSKNEIESTETS